MTFRVRAVELRPEFEKHLRDLPEHIQKRAIRAIDILREDPMHPSLRLHRLSGKLEGLWSITLTRKHRIVFQYRENGVALLVTVGAHDTYQP